MEGERPELSAIVLCYRAEDNLRHVVQPLYGDLFKSGVSFELILVGNYMPGQEDRTPAIVEEFARTHEHVVPVIKPKEGGMGWDMRSGFEAARGNYMVMIDGDEQNPVEDLLGAYWQMKRRNLEVVKGRRIARFDGYFRQLISLVYNAVFLLMFHTYGMWDINGKPKGMTRAAYEQMELTADDWFSDAEIVLQAMRKGMRIGEMPVVFHSNLERQSFVRTSAILEFLRNMFRQRLGRSS